ncbi:MAG: MFS transporter [Actinomycetota bacterium]
MKAGWALLRRRDFGLLWAGGLISETGDWFLLVGLPFWVLQETGSSLVTASVFLVGLLPGLVVGPLAGVLVDRWDRRRTLVAVSLAEAAFLLPLLAVDGRDRLWIVYLVIAVEATLAQLNDPARNALVPTLVPKDDLVGANALIGLNTNVARLAGSPLGGILVEVAGLPGWSSATPPRSSSVWRSSGWFVRSEWVARAWWGVRAPWTVRPRWSTRWPWTPWPPRTVRSPSTPRSAWTPRPPGIPRSPPSPPSPPSGRAPTRPRGSRAPGGGA